MKTWVRFNLLRQFKKHFLIIAFSVISILYLFNLLYADDFLGLNSNPETFLRIKVLTLIFFLTIFSFSFFFTKRLKQHLSKNLRWLIVAIRLAFCSILAYSLYRFILVFHSILNELTENISFIFESIITRIVSNSRSESRGSFLTPAVFDLLFSVITLVFLVFAIFGFSFEITPIVFDYSISYSFVREYFFEFEVSLGFLYKALP